MRHLAIEISQAEFSAKTLSKQSNWMVSDHSFLMLRRVSLVVARD